MYEGSRLCSRYVMFVDDEHYCSDFDSNSYLDSTKVAAIALLVVSILSLIISFL